jgi:hypothetical protein
MRHQHNLYCCLIGKKTKEKKGSSHDQIKESRDVSLLELYGFLLDLGKLPTDVNDLTIKKPFFKRNRRQNERWISSRRMKL